MSRRWCVAYMRGLRVAERRFYRSRRLALRSVARWERRYGKGSAVCWDTFGLDGW